MNVHDLPPAESPWRRNEATFSVKDAADLMRRAKHFKDTARNPGAPESVRVEREDGQAATIPLGYWLNMCNAARELRSSMNLYTRQGAYADLQDMHVWLAMLGLYVHRIEKFIEVENRPLEKSA